MVTEAEKVINNITPEKWNDVQVKIVFITKQVLGVGLDKILLDVTNMGSGK